MISRRYKRLLWILFVSITLPLWIFPVLFYNLWQLLIEEIDYQLALEDWKASLDREPHAKKIERDPLDIN